MTRREVGPLDHEPVNIRPPFDVRVPPPAPPARHLGSGAAFEAWRAERLADRVAALTEPLAGLELGAYDRRMVEWLAGFDIPTVGGVVPAPSRSRGSTPSEVVMTEYRLIMLCGGVLLGLAPLTAVWPVIDVVMTTLLLGTGGVVIAGYWLREAVRELRFRREMRALDSARPHRTEVPT